MPDRPMHKGRWIAGGIVAVYGALVFLTFDIIEEDAYIYFRFAANIAEGHGYVFNRGGPPVESGSSLVWQLLLVPLYLIDPELVIATKLMGVGFGLGSLLLLRRLSGRFTNDAVLTWLPAILLTVSYPFYMWSHMGLETPLFLLLCLWFVYCLIDERQARFWPLAGALIVFARPEGFMLCLCLLRAWVYRRDSLVTRRSLTIFTGLVVAVELFRLLYFQDLLPHTFYNKIFTSDRPLSEAILTFLLRSLTGLVLLAVLGLSLKVLLRSRSIGYRGWVLLIALLVALVWGGVGTDLKYFNRSFTVALAFLYLALSATLSALRFTPGQLTLMKGVALAFALPLLFLARTAQGDFVVNALRSATEPFFDTELSLRRRIAHWFTPHTHLPRDVEKIFYAPREFLYDNHQVMAGEFIALNYPPDIRVVYDQMGHTPWYAGADVHFIDTLGVIDRPIGYFLFNRKMEHSGLLHAFGAMTRPLLGLIDGEDRSRWTEQAALDYIFDQEPALILLHGLILSRDPDSLPARINADPRLRERYVLKYGINLTVLYERRDIQTDPRGIVYPDNCACSRIAEADDGSYVVPTDP